MIRYFVRYTQIGVGFTTPKNTVLELDRPIQDRDDIRKVERMIEKDDASETTHIVVLDHFIPIHSGPSTEEQ